MANDNEKKVILGAFAPYEADARGYLRHVSKENQSLQGILEDASDWEWKSLPDADYDVIFETIRKRRNELVVFHYSGHADLRGLRPTGGAAGFMAEDLADLLKTAPKLKLVFLNGCSTLGLVDQLLAAGVPCVIATATLILDAVAREFAAQFFDALKSGDTVQEAFDMTAIYIRGKDRGQGANREYRHFYNNKAGAGNSIPDDLGNGGIPWLIKGGENARKWKLVGDAASGSRAPGPWLGIFMSAFHDQLGKLRVFDEEEPRKNLIRDLAQQGITISCDPADVSANAQMLAVVRACLGEPERRDKLLSALGGVVGRHQYADLHRSIETFTILESIWPLLKCLHVPIRRRKEIYGVTLNGAPRGIPLTLDKMALELFDETDPFKFHEFVMRMAKEDPDREQSILEELKRVMTDPQEYEDLRQRLVDKAAEEFHFLSCNLEDSGMSYCWLHNSNGELVHKGDFSCSCSPENGFPSGIEVALRDALCHVPAGGKPIIEFFIRSGSLRHRAHTWEWEDSGAPPLPLGTRYPVIVRWSDRFEKSRDSSEAQLRTSAWHSRMDALRQSFSSQTQPEIRWIESDHEKGKLYLKLDPKKGVVIPGFQFVPVAAGAAAISPLLEMVLNAGIPFCFWFHNEPEDWEQTKATVTELLRLPGIEPIAWKLKELREQEYDADKDSALTIFWDDPKRDLLKDVLLPPQATPPHP